MNVVCIGLIDQSLICHHQILPEDEFIVVILEKKILTQCCTHIFQTRPLYWFQIKKVSTATTSNSSPEIGKTDNYWWNVMYNSHRSVTDLSSSDTPRRWVHYHHLTKIILQYLLASEERSVCHCPSDLMVGGASRFGTLLNSLAWVTLRRSSNFE